MLTKYILSGESLLENAVFTHYGRNAFECGQVAEWLKAHAWKAC